VSTLAGSGEATWGDGQGTQAHFNAPFGVAVDGEGNVIVADTDNHRIRNIAAGLVPYTPQARALPQLPSEFVPHFEALLNDQTFSDVTFVVGDTRIQAHRAILAARSDYFRSMLTSPFREGEAHEISIGDTTPQAFKSLLRYLYTDELQFADEHLIDVMRKAKEISLERVYNHTVQRCRRDISVHNVVGWFVQADEHGLEELRSATIGFLARNIRLVKRNAKQTLEILSDKPHLMMEVIDAI
jgi:speckle-type POZ protein